LEQADVAASAQLKNGKEVTIETLAQLQTIIATNKGKSGASIRVLQQAQGLIGYLPPLLLETISRSMGISLSELYGIVSFYHFFALKPKGRHVIQVCMGTSCYVKGGQRILNAFKRDYCLEPGEITSDGKFSLEIVRCLGCCGLSPVMAIGSDIHRKIKPSKLAEILSAYK
jgi:NADH:ubiquinone oxidoreductase subunit E